MDTPQPSPNAPQPSPPDELQPGDFYYEGEYLVFTAQYLLRRGYCCNNGCRHCPYRENDYED
ncbi:MAG: hypothetical protein HOQ35_18160 [Acidobacteriaceae bacterium]|nr:hypothetical protein [Acidobacteriaceae bacterium]